MENNHDNQQAVAMTDQSPEGSEAQELTLNEDKFKDLMARMQAKENLVMGLVGGVVAAVLGAGIWAAVTIATGVQIGWMAVGVGFLCGYAVRFMGKGISAYFGYVGAACALFGCLLGNFFTIVGFIGKEESMGFFEVLGLLDYGALPELMSITFHPMDLLFYGIAVYGGYKASFVKFSEEQLQSVVD